MLKRFVVTGALLVASPALAEDYVSRHIALTEAFTREMSRVGGGDPNWTVPADMREQMACAIGELERRRGRAVVEEYLRWSEWAVEEARKLPGVDGFGTLISQIHTRSDIDFYEDLGPIAETCGIGL